MSDDLERVCLSEEASSSLVQSYRVLKIKIVDLKIEMATTKAETRASREECARLRALRGIMVDFLMAFDLILVPDFVDIYPTWVVVVTRDECLAKKLDK
ncbi:hypothetical protein POTOM_032518 [Populus tomentosa]|uniref:Uncharacterized protein n=1 Tax=Populus tomentosa TaxID=118781 RepID=A0A8X7Z8R0_POPTO|nr:hypothetical protein POTOM_032518 [Populus tomentosa]